MSPRQQTTKNVSNKLPPNTTKFQKKPSAKTLKQQSQVFKNKKPSIKEFSVDDQQSSQQDLMINDEFQLDQADPYKNTSRKKPDSKKASKATKVDKVNRLAKL